MAQQNNKNSFVVQLRTDDNQIISVDCKIAASIKSIGDSVQMAVLGQEEEAIIIPVKNVQAPILKLIIKWLSLKAEAKTVQNNQFDGKKTLLSLLPQKFDRTILIQVTSAAHTLNVASLLDVCCKYTAELISEAGSVEGIRQLFGIVNDFSAEVEAKIREEKKWFKGSK